MNRQPPPPPPLQTDPGEDPALGAAPVLLALGFTALLTVVVLSGCPGLGEADHPTRDDTSQPADDGGGCEPAAETGGSCDAQLELAEARILELEQQLEQCKPAGEPK
jgi:hypothetical protein